MTYLVFIEYQQWKNKNWSIGSGAGFPVQWPCFQRDGVAPRSNQPFILPRLIKLVPEISRNWVRKRKMPPCSGSVDFRQLNLKGVIKFFFEEDTRNITLDAIKTIWFLNLNYKWKRNKNHQMQFFKREFEKSYGSLKERSNFAWIWKDILQWNI